MILIDTHIWLWWAFNPKRLSKPQQDAIHAHQETTIGVCSISCWEVAQLDQLGRIDLGVPVKKWIDDALRFPGVRWLAMTPPVVCQAFDLPKGFHKDPADRLIAATALVHGVPLVTSDQQIIQHRAITTIH